MAETVTNDKRILVAAIGFPPTYDMAPSSRALYLFNELRKTFPETFVVMKDDDKGVRLDNLFLVRPFIPIAGRMAFLKGLLYRLQASVYVLRFARKHDVDVVILRGYDNAIFFPFLKLLNIKIIYDFHGLASEEQSTEKRHLRAFISRHLDTMMLRGSEKILAVSEGVKAQISPLADKCLYLPNGIDLDMMRNANLSNPLPLEEKKLIGFIGNSEHYMHTEDICEAMNYLPGQACVLIGWGHDTGRLMKKYDSCKNLVFTGRLPPAEAYAILKKCAVFVLPYGNDDKNSQIPDFYRNRKTREYIAAGKPIIVADIPGKENILVDGYNCLYYRPGDPRDLAEKVTTLLNNPTLYDKQRLNNEALAPSFGWGSIVRESGLFEEITCMLSR